MLYYSIWHITPRSSSFTQPRERMLYIRSCITSLQAVYKQFGCLWILWEKPSLSRMKKMQRNISGSAGYTCVQNQTYSVASARAVTGSILCFITRGSTVQFISQKMGGSQYFLLYGNQMKKSLMGVHLFVPKWNDGKPTLWCTGGLGLSPAWSPLSKVLMKKSLPCGVPEVWVYPRHYPPCPRSWWGRFSAGSPGWPARGGAMTSYRAWLTS